VTSADETGEAARRVLRWSARTLGVRTALLAVTLPLGAPGPVSGQAEAVRVHAAGSLRANAAQAARERPSLQIVPLPVALGVGADYGLTVLTGARLQSARRRVSFILSPDGQAILARHGFAAPTGPGG
jgi:ABC-type molybdate transport system substrate-binding protein